MFLLSEMLEDVSQVSSFGLKFWKITKTVVYNRWRHIVVVTKLSKCYNTYLAVHDGGKINIDIEDSFTTLLKWFELLNLYGYNLPPKKGRNNGGMAMGVFPGN